MEKLWGGRFKKDTSKVMQRFISSISFDKRLVRYDIAGSIAHALMLGKCGIINKEESQKIVQGLKELLQEIERGILPVDDKAEDIHTWVENKLKEKIGEIAGKLHTARSRNDQVALDERMYLKEELANIQQVLSDLLKTILTAARNYLGVIMSGYTHLQHAQPVLFSHHLLAYFFKFKRDWQRLQDLYSRVDVLPLGSAALAGTSHPIDRDFVRKKLKFSQISQNSLDAVSDRDFIIEFLADVSLIMLHLSSLSEELILWSSREFNFIELDESFCTGSSIMPQKKNPDAAELIRGKTGRIYGHLLSMLTTMKALPLAYNHDLQEDKEPLFDTVEVVKSSLTIMRGMIETLQVKSDNMKQSLEGDLSNATELADYLVRKGLSFREAHSVVGEIVIYCLDRKKSLEQLTLEELQQFQSVFQQDVFSLLTPEAVINAKNSFGGTSLKKVREIIEEEEKTIKIIKN
ncbi:MAG: argininosuccinate lyase [Atribacterota bacterium]|nr:argininosuccinate lyase [Atribacterota bacterium]MDD4896043.1 argininosuccinate lyase [Atribacterota bacterium]MDD5637302.1 argininosuccinate lyase [Atribacterota bacterium]